MPKLPTGELVAKAYAKYALAAAGLGTVPVATSLPDVAAWAETGAVQIDGIVGTTYRENNLRDMVASYSGWAARLDSDKPPYGQANELMEVIRESAFWDWPSAVELSLEPAGVYSDVVIHAVHPVTEPRRIPDQDQSRAHYTMDFRVVWAVA